EGARVTETLGLSEEARAAIPIDHIIVLMKENRSFDHILGRLHEAGQPEAEAIPDTFVNYDLKRVPVSPFHATTTCISSDPDHQWAGRHAQGTGGKLRRLVTTGARSTRPAGHSTTSYTDEP